MRVFLAPLLIALAGCGAEQETLPEGESACAADAELPGAGPHLCPALSPIAYCERLTGVVHSTDLVLSNRGTETIDIVDVRIRGDARCSFRPPVIDVMEIEPSVGAAVIRIDYVPSSAGDDRAILEIESNAANFPLLEIGVCGRAIAGIADQTGKCPQCATPETDDPACAPDE